MVRCIEMECHGHTCIHWTSNDLVQLCNSVEDITCRRLKQFPDLWVRCRAAEAKMEGPNSRPPQSYPSFPPPSIATESHRSPSPLPRVDPPLPQTPPSPPPLLSSPSSPPLHSHLHTPPSRTPHSPLPPHTPLTPHSPLTPLTSQSTLASEASVDSGVTSAHSLDLLHSTGSEAHALRKRAGSSVSSGTSEVWLGSLDGDPAGLEVLPELWPHSESPTAPTAMASQSPSSPRRVPAVRPCDPSSSEMAPLSPRQSPTPGHRSPAPSCHSPPILQDRHGPPTPHRFLPPASEVAVGTSPPPAIDEDCVWHASSPRDHHPKEAFSSVIPFHPSALKSHPGHVRPTSERDGKNTSMDVLADNPRLPGECVLNSDLSPTDFSLSEALCEKKSCCAREGESLPQDGCEANGPMTGEKDSEEDLLAVERMAREGCIWIDKFASLFVKQILEEALAVSCSLGWSIKCSGQCQREQCREEYQKKESSWWAGGGGKSSRKSSIPLLGLSCGSPGLCWTPELPYSPSHRPHSRSSLGSSLSFSHDSLISSGPRMDDSHLITGAVSHDALLFPTSKTPHGHVSDIYNVPLDGDIYAVPVDVVKPNEGQILHPKAIVLQPKKRHHRRHPKHGAGGSTNIYTDGGSKRAGSHDHAIGGKQLKEGGSGRSRQHSGQSVGSAGGDILRASKRHSVPSNIGCASSTTPKHGASKDGREPIHMTLEEVRKSFHESDDAINCNKNHAVRQEPRAVPEQSKMCRIIPFTSMKSCKRKENAEGRPPEDNRKRGRSISSNIRNTLITIFGLKKGTKSSSPRLKNGNCVEAASQGFSHIVGNGVATPAGCPAPGPQPNPPAVTTLGKNHHNQHNHHGNQRHSNGINTGLLSCLGNHRADPDDQPLPVQVPVANAVPSRSPAVVTNRALPPLPLPNGGDDEQDSGAAQNGSGSERREEEGCDFASIIEKVKDCGWYWGPISGEAAEKVLANEPDGSFIVRDSSDHHYIFSLTFKLNGFIRHVRIEHDQGNFSFGGFTKFKSQTIVEFIENAVEHSRSGRYLFFLHRRPVLGPMRVQLLHPVSRFKHIQSLQHLCRFVIVKHVRRDLIRELPLPQRLKDYLCSPHYYSERVEQCMAAAAAAAAAAASEGEESGSPSGALGEGQGVVPSQVLESSLGELQDGGLPATPVLLPGFPGIPQPVMDRASQTSQAASPNPPNHCYPEFPPHDSTQQEQQEEEEEKSTTANHVETTKITATSLPVLLDAEFDVSSAQSSSPPPPETITESSQHHHPYLQHHYHSSSSPICCSPARVECDTEPECPRVRPTGRAHTASASSPAPQGNLAFAHQHTTGASGPLSLDSSTNDESQSPFRATFAQDDGGPESADEGGVLASATGAVGTGGFFPIDPCVGLEDHVFEDLGGV